MAPDAETKRLVLDVEHARRVERLVHDGASRLTAERIAAIERGVETVGRARRHVLSHR